ncbi:unnamed protein product [Boreogadus saida]
MDSGAVLRRNRRHLQALPESADSSEEQQLRARPTPLPSGSSPAASPALSDKQPDQMSPDRAVGHASPHTPPGGGGYRPNPISLLCLNPTPHCYPSLLPLPNGTTLPCDVIMASPCPLADNQTPVVGLNKTKTRNSLALDGTLSSIMTIKMADLEPCFKWEPPSDVLKASKKATGQYNRAHRS